jgi:hypothetical protein
MTTRLRAAAGLALWLAFLVAVLFVVAAAGTGALAAPPVTGGAPAFARWLDGRDAAQAAFAFLRLVVLALAAYLLVTTVIALGLRLARADRSADAVERLTIPTVRRLVQTAAGASVAVSLVVAGGAAAVAGAAQTAATSSGAVTMRRLPDDGAVTPVTMRRLDDGAAAGVDAPTMRRLPDDAAPTPVASEPATAAGPAARTWTVRHGDSFWRIARHSLAEAWGRAPSDRELTPYWSAVVETNRSMLRDPGNPDLLFPGDVVALPACPDPPPTSGGG